MTNQRAVSDSFRIGRDDIYTCLYLFFNQSGRIPVVHANRCINMYYNRLYHPSRNINHLFRKSVNRYSARFTLFYPVISIKLHNFVFVNISLAERSSLFHNILSFYSPYQSIEIIHRKCLSAPFLPVAGRLRFPWADSVCRYISS